MINPVQSSEPRKPSERIKTVDEQTRQDIKNAMKQVAEENFDLRIDTENIALSSRDDLTVVSSLVADFQDLEHTGPQRTATVGLAYIALPPEARIKQVTGTRTTLPRKFYAVQIRSLTNKAHLINSFNQPGAIVQLQQADSLPSLQPQIEVSGCKVVLRYVQESETVGKPVIRAEVPIDWCERGF